MSFTGSNMQSAAILWHVSLLVPPGQKGLALGAVGLVRVVPIVVFSMIGGVVADAWHRRRLMLMTQSAATLVALTLALVTGRGLITLPLLYSLTALGSTVVVVRSAGPAGTGPVAGAAGGSRQRAQPEHRDDAGRLDRRTGDRRHPDRHARPDLGLPAQRDFVRVRHRRAAADARHSRGRQPDRARRRVLAFRGRRAALRLQLAAHPVDDAAGFLCDVLFVRRGAAADLRAGHPARRRRRVTAGSMRHRPPARC